MSDNQCARESWMLRGQSKRKKQQISGAKWAKQAVFRLFDSAQYRALKVFKSTPYFWRSFSFSKSCLSRWNLETA
eukprot:3941914-Rhodomonas_salina.3